MIRNTMILTFVLVITVHVSIAQEGDRDPVLNAMKDELSRNMESLRLEGIENPFYISYLVLTGKSYNIQASLGSIVKSTVQTPGNGSVKVLVGDYHLNNTNFKGAMWEWSNVDYPEFPLSPDYLGYRYELWKITDQTYKESGENLVKKKTAMKQQLLSAQDTVPDDYLKGSAVDRYIIKNVPQFDQKDFEHKIRAVSTVFLEYKDLVESKVRFVYYPLQVYFTDSEGSESSFPLHYMVMRVSATAIAEDGEKIYDEMDFYWQDPEKVPALESIKKEVSEFAANLLANANATALDEDYYGPVLIEGEAAAEVFTTKFFSSKKGFYANRVPVCIDESTKKELANSFKSLEMKIGRRILPTTFTVTARPELTDWNGFFLAGHYPLDAQGVIPKEVTLVENGIVKQVLTDRTPTLNSPESTGNSRIVFNSSSLVQKAPGVIHVQNSKGINNKKLKAELLKAAKKEGLSYALIIRKTVKDDNSNSYYSEDEGSKLNLKALNIYKVDVASGTETLIRSAELQDISFSSFKNVSFTSSKEFACNTVLYDQYKKYYDSPLTGVPVSIILPYAFLFGELEIVKKDMSGTAIPPVVTNPLKK